jgi:hypothetical protein
MFNILSWSSKSATGAKNSPRIALLGCGAIAEEYYLPALGRHVSILENLILVDRAVTRGALRLGVKRFVHPCGVEVYRYQSGEIDD